MTIRGACLLVQVRGTSLHSTEELLMARPTGDAMTEVAQEELSQIPLISRLAATTNIPTSLVHV